MTAKIIDGQAIAADLRGKVADAVHRLTRDRGIVPGLAVVLVGENPASESYVGSKVKLTKGSGMPSFDHRLAENATVTVAHSRTRDLAAACRRAEILFAAVGRAEFVRRNWVKPGATVIDVGINRVTDASGKASIVGDVAFAEVSTVAGAITP